MLQTHTVSPPTVCKHTPCAYSLPNTFFNRSPLRTTIAIPPLGPFSLLYSYTEKPGMVGRHVAGGSHVSCRHRTSRSYSSNNNSTLYKLNPAILTLPTCSPCCSHLSSLVDLACLRLAEPLFRLPLCLSDSW